MSKRIDLTGQRFGRLIVIKPSKSIKNPGGKLSSTWECKCDCGKTKIIRTDILRRGDVKSCGCLNSELITKRNKKPQNIYYIKDKIAYVKDVNNKEFILDEDVWNNLKQYRWYVSTTSKKDNRQCVKRTDGERIHRLIMNCPEGLTVDHINHNPLDNRKSNLRICTSQENSWNSSKCIKNTSGFIGVSKKRKKFLAQIRHNGKLYRKIFTTPEKAARWRDKMAKKLRGEFAVLNFPEDK